MRYSDQLLDEIRARLPVSQVVARKVPLKRAGREFKGLSPFKDEKTPSFTVNDQKGFYHCFATGEHGDIFKFLMQTEGVSFPEAVQMLAEEAGVTLPKLTPRSQEEEDARSRLYRLIEDSAAFFEGALHDAGGAHARSYLEERGLSGETQRRFRMGYAPAGRSVLKSFLAGKGYSEQEMIASGMAIGGEDIAVSYDRFRDRVMFPIRDAGGRVIAFGGRALSADVPAKYLNSPETPLFHKGSVLYNMDQARKAAYDAQMVIAVEGYMDVIALAAAGFDHAVAPLGTALTENQISLLWRLHAEPVLCFDGDAAGRKAAYRAIDTVLPHLKPGYSLRFAFMPDGMDPDDLIKVRGAAAVTRVLDDAQPLMEVFWAREWSGGSWDTPERRAMLEKQVRDHTQKIEDQSVRYHYETEMRQRLRDSWRTSAVREAPGEGRYRSGGMTRNRHDGIRSRYSGGASNKLRGSAIASNSAPEIPVREALIAQALLNHPWLLDEHCEVVASLFFSSDVVTSVRDALLEAAALEIPLETEALIQHLIRNGQQGALDGIQAVLPPVADRFLQVGNAADVVQIGWKHLISLHSKLLSLRQELEIAEQNFASDYSEHALARVVELTRQLNDAQDEQRALAGAEAVIARLNEEVRNGE